MQVFGATALVTGAGGGIGSALVSRLLERGAERVYAADLEIGAIGASDGRVTPVALDVTDGAQIAAFAALITLGFMVFQSHGGRVAAHEMNTGRSVTKNQRRPNLWVSTPSCRREADRESYQRL